MTLNGSGINLDSNGNVQAVVQGSSAPLTAKAATKIVSIAYGNFSASSTFYPTFAALSRNARQRSLFLKNNMDQPLSAVSFMVYDSAVPAGTKTMHGTMDAPTANGGIGVQTSENSSWLAVHGDTLQLGLGMGSTAPTTGTLDVYLVELI